MVSCLDSLVQSCCGEEGALKTNFIGLCGEHSQCSGHTGFAPLMGVFFRHLHCSGSRMLYRKRAMHCVQFQFSGTPQKHRLNWACVLCFPRPEQLRQQELDECTLPGCSATYPFGGPSLSFHQPLLGVPCVCSGELVSSHDPPSRCDPFRISGSLWLITGSLFAVW